MRETRRDPCLSAYVVNADRALIQSCQALAASLGATPLLAVYSSPEASAKRMADLIAEVCYIPSSS